jgi:arabinose-5-phosphate isomerase
MTRAPKTIEPDALASEALEQLNSLKITSLFVIDAEKKPVGLVHIHDLLRIGLV